MDVKEFLEKSLSFGLGLAVFSREKIEELVEEMVRRGEVAQKDARQFAGDLVKKGDEQRQEMRKLIREEIVAALKELGFAAPAAPAAEAAPGAAADARTAGPDQSGGTQG